MISKYYLLQEKFHCDVLFYSHEKMSCMQYLIQICNYFFIVYCMYRMWITMLYIIKCIIVEPPKTKIRLQSHKIYLSVLMIVMLTFPAKFDILYRHSIIKLVRLNLLLLPRFKLFIVKKLIRLCTSFCNNSNLEQIIIIKTKRR